MFFWTHMRQQCVVSEYEWIVYMHLWQRLHRRWPHLSRHDCKLYFYSSSVILSACCLYAHLNISLSEVRYSSFDDMASSVISDLDECSLNTHNCDTNAQCNNVPGSFTCRCNYANGYYGNGTECFPYRMYFSDIIFNLDVFFSSLDSVLVYQYIYTDFASK